LTIFFSFRLAASCMAISQKGLMYILVLVRSTALSFTLIWVREWYLLGGVVDNFLECDQYLH
jgi:hypothetical protein